MSRRIRGIGLVAALAVLASACGSTAYRDRVEIAAQAPGATTPLPGLPSATPTDGQGPVAGAPTDVTPTPGATTLATPLPGTTASPTPGAQPTTGTGVPPSTGPSAQPSPGTTTQPTAQALPQTTENFRATDDEIRVGFTYITSFQQLGSQMSNSPPEKGDVRKQIEDLVAWINSNGGVAGRTVVPVIKGFKQEESSPGLEAQVCNAFADDENVFAALLVGMIQADTRSCLASKRVLSFDTASFAYDSTLFETASPYYWSLPTPVYDRVLRALPGALDTMDYFAPMVSRDETETKVGVVAWDIPWTKRLLQRDLQPALQAIGRDVDVVRFVDGATIGTMQKGLTDAIVAFREAGVNRVFFIGTSPLAPFFTNQAENEEYRPRYAMTSLDQPRFTANPDEGKVPLQAVDAMGIGFSPDTDVEDDRYAWPSPTNQTEQLCLQVLNAAGHTWTARKNANVGVGFCGGLLMLQKGGETIAQGITPELWAYHAERNLVGFQSPMNFGSSFGPGDHAAPETYRLLKWLPECQCFDYVSGEIALP